MLVESGGDDDNDDDDNDGEDGVDDAGSVNEAACVCSVTTSSLDL